MWCSQPTHGTFIPIDGCPKQRCQLSIVLCFQVGTKLHVNPKHILGRLPWVKYGWQVAGMQCRGYQWVMAMEQALARNVERCCMFLFVSLGWKAFMRGNDTSLTILMCLKMGDARWQCSNGHKDDDSITPWHSGVPYFENLPLISAVINIPQILHVSPCQVRLAILWGI